LLASAVQCGSFRSGLNTCSTFRFTEGFDTLDLKEAKAMLGELHA
jgi:hypothetical protein